MTTPERSDIPVVLRERGEWILIYQGLACRRPDSAGMNHLAALLRQPRVEISVLFLEQRQRQPDVGSTRRTPLHDARDRARSHVAAAIAAEIACVGTTHSALAHHLRRHIRIGEFCVYAPEPEAESDSESNEPSHERPKPPVSSVHGAIG